MADVSSRDFSSRFQLIKEKIKGQQYIFMMLNATATSWCLMLLSLHLEWQACVSDKTFQFCQECLLGSGLLVHALYKPLNFWKNLNQRHWTEYMRDDTLEPANLYDRSMIAIDVGVGIGFTTLQIMKHVDVKNQIILEISPHQLVDYTSARNTKHWPASPYGIRDAYMVLKIGGKSCLIHPVIIRNKVMVVTVRCEEIANEKYSSFTAIKDWCEVKQAVQSHSVKGFGEKLSSILDIYLLDCTEYFMKISDEGCADAIIRQANWDNAKTRDKLQRDIDTHVAAVCIDKLAELNSSYEKKLNEALSSSVEALLNGTGDQWRMHVGGS